MKASDIPDKISVAFGALAGGGFITTIPVDSQIGIANGRASYETGFPPLNFLPTGAGGVPPFGADVNGILFAISAWSKWQGAGGPIPYDSALAADISGYPAGAIVAATNFGQFWLCNTDDNETDPDAGGAGWQLLLGLTKSALTGAAQTYTQAQAVRQIVRSNSGAAMIDVLPGTSPGVLAAGTIISVFNGDAAGMLAVTVGSGATLKGENAFAMLGPGQSARFLSDGTDYYPISVPVRARLGANTTIYVDTAGSNSNVGLTAAVPFLTMQAAFDYAQDNFDLAGYVLTFQAANGTYGAGVSCTGRFVGQSGPSSVILRGDPTTPANVTINGVGPLIWLQDGAMEITGLKLTGTVGSIRCSNDCWLRFGNIDFGANNQYHILAECGTKVEMTASYTISGSVDNHWYAADNGVIDIGYIGTNVVITLTGNPTFGLAFAQATATGLIVYNHTNVTFAGTGTGKRYDVTANGVIANTASTTVFPGNQVGTTATGGQYT